MASHENSAALCAEYAALTSHRHALVNHVQQWLRLGFGASITAFAFFYFPSSGTAQPHRMALGSVVALVFLWCCIYVANRTDTVIVRYCYPRLVALELLLNLHSVRVYLKGSPSQPRATAQLVEACESLLGRRDDEIWGGVRQKFSEYQAPRADRLFDVFYWEGSALSLLYFGTALYWGGCWLTSGCS